MSDIFISGLGAVSPAGWGVAALRDAAAKGLPLPFQQIERPGFLGKLNVLKVPTSNPRPSFLAHPRLRRASAISHYAMASVLEALGPEPQSSSSTAVIACVFSGCVNYSRRFYGEALNDPATASPLLFPETVFNAPASHISAYLGSNAINYTLVGDTATILAGVALGARWLLEGRADRCLVVGTEEIDWLTADALRLFDRTKCLSEGAAAVLLTRYGDRSAARLERVTGESLYSNGGKRRALRQVKEELGIADAAGILFDSSSGPTRISREENEVWNDWPGARVSIRKIAGEGLMASAAWQLVLAADAIKTNPGQTAVVNIAGFHQHAVGAKLVSAQA